MYDKELKRIYDANLTPEMRERKRERNRINKNSPYGKFKGQKDRAKKRGVEWQLTFDEWYNWWQQTGHWEERGRGKGGYVMARIGDTGPYSLNNIKCITQSENASEYFSKY